MALVVPDQRRLLQDVEQAPGSAGPPQVPDVRSQPHRDARRPDHGSLAALYRAGGGAVKAAAGAGVRQSSQRRADQHRWRQNLERARQHPPDAERPLLRLGRKQPRRTRRRPDRDDRPRRRARRRAVLRRIPRRRQDMARVRHEDLRAQPWQQGHAVRARRRRGGHAAQPKPQAPQPAGPLDQLRRYEDLALSPRARAAVVRRAEGKSELPRRLREPRPAMAPLRVRRQPSPRRGLFGEVAVGARTRDRRAAERAAGVAVAAAQGLPPAAFRATRRDLLHRQRQRLPLRRHLVSLGPRTAINTRRGPTA